MVSNRALYLLVLIFPLFAASCKGDGPRAARDYDVWGIDVSRHQNSISWENVFETEKPDFVFVKATEGTLIKDNMYDNHRKTLNDSDILWGAYHFFGHRTSGREQALNFIKTAKLKKGNLIPVLDIEWHRFFKDPQKLVREVNAFCREIKKTYGVYPIIYCSTLFYEKYLWKNFPQDNYVLWIADYRGKPSIDWNFWQHTDSHKIKGVNTCVDRNVFAGDYDSLKKLILK